jgi:hypothetical protein
LTAAPPGPVASVGAGGVAEIVGLPVSVTTTLKPVGEEALPRTSVAVHETGVVPIEKEVPEAGLQTTPTGSLTPLTSGGAVTL